MSTAVHQTMLRNEHAITYEVMVNGRRVWSRTVAFGKKKSHRAGGAAFVQAAREQEQVAGRYLAAAS